MEIEYLVSLSFPLVGNPSDLFNIAKKDSGQAGMTEIWNCDRDRSNSYKLSHISAAFPFQIISQKAPAVFVFMAIHTEILPVRAIRGVIEAIPVFMMYSEKTPVFVINLSPAFGADQAMYFD